MLTTFRVRAVESVHQAGKLWIQLTSRFDFTVPGTGEPTKYGGRDADPEKPIVMGKCRLGCGSTRGEPLECQPDVDLQMLGAPGTEWAWRRMISSVKVLHQFVVRPSCRVFCLSLMLVCEHLGSCQNPQVFQSYKETTQQQIFFFSEHKCYCKFFDIQRMLTILLYKISISLCGVLMNNLEVTNTYILSNVDTYCGHI